MKRLEVGLMTGIKGSVCNESSSASETVSGSMVRSSSMWTFGWLESVSESDSWKNSLRCFVFRDQDFRSFGAVYILFGWIRLVAIDVLNSIVAW